MNYNAIKTLALKYVDRKDQDVIDQMDNFLRLVEARINRRIRVGNSTKRATMSVDANGLYVGLPSDFAGLRDIQVVPSDKTGSAVSPDYVSPKTMNDTLFMGSDKLVYTIIAGQIQISPLADDSEIEIVYYAGLTPLTSSQPDTWLSDLNPDVYVFGLCVEINAYVKDIEAGSLWDRRFKEELDNISISDANDRWSGAPLQIQLG